MKDVKFILPFNGFWLTFWGGDTAAQNHHHGVTSQKHAFDFIKTSSNGKFYRTNGETVEDYFSFGADILAPAHGVIIEVVDGLRDNKPGESNNFSYIGNYIMIKHSENLFSVLGHLLQNSIVTKVGDKVSSGDKIAKCGNSGNTTEPHLHFQVQNHDVFTKIDKEYNYIDVAKGQKVVFEQMTVIKSSKPEIKSKYSPVKGDKVSNTNERLQA